MYKLDITVLLLLLLTGGGVGGARKLICAEEGCIGVMHSDGSHSGGEADRFRTGDRCGEGVNGFGVGQTAARAASVTSGCWRRRRWGERHAREERQI
jgi:hypothetical protein